jgi:prephenate dehydrogenase
MRLFNKVAIIGVGLVGGSVGLGIKKRRLAKQVIGISRHRKTINLALRRGAIDCGYLNIAAVGEADLVVLAAPVNSIINIGRRISPSVKPGALVTDTGSTKKLIVKTLEDILPNFIGAHPLSGSEKHGVGNACSDLFCDSLCVLTPTAKTSQKVISKIKRFWIELGARIICISPSRHDKLMSYASHLSHIVSFSIIHSVPGNSLYLASSGLRDTTRIAASPETLWRDILLTNSENVLDAVQRFLSSLSRITGAIRHKDAKLLEGILKQARLKREYLESSSKLYNRR